MSTITAPCEHDHLLCDVVNTSRLKYRSPASHVIDEALAVDEPAQKKTKKPKPAEKNKSQSALPSASTFPAPVIVPGDEIYHDPDYPPQSVQEWVDEEHRNEVTAKRKTIYVVPPPALPEDLAHLDGWTTADNGPSLPTLASASPKAPRPRANDVVDYLAAFYHGLPVKILEKPSLAFTTWDDPPPPTKSKLRPQILTHIALSTGTEAIRIRCRSSPGGIFSAQLSLNDLLDTAISILPADAHALLMLVDQDMYESDDDDFCCGRAYGGSRVAVVSTARYRPEHDEQQEVDREHSWPSSHCHEWIARQYGRKPPAKRSLASTRELAEEQGSAVAAAVLAANALAPPTTPDQLSALWLGRVCKTASHELGHCFGTDHCIYFACIMQGTACMAEDVRQPPYLCPVDLSKVLRATGASEKERYKALAAFCEKWQKDRIFAAFGAWLRVRLEQPDAITI